MSEPTQNEPTASASATHSHTELKVAAAALAAAASAPLGIAVAAGAALSSPDVRDALRRGTVKAVAGAIQATDQITAAVARRATPTDNPPETSEPDA
jgi:ABC-type proline/glycine betaine transport system permease subunit